MEQEGMIQRYISLQRSVNSAAGVYFISTTLPLEAKFNIIYNSLYLSARAFDTVTVQSILGNCALQMFFRDDNPAIISNRESVAGTACRYGLHTYLPIWVEFAAGQGSLNANVTFTSETVTANQISHVIYLTVGYLCPEDYLSVHPLIKA